MLEQQSLQATPQPSLNTEDFTREIEQIRGEKLAEMEKVAGLEEQINQMMERQAQKEAEWSEALINKDNQIEELKFVNHQLQGMQAQQDGEVGKENSPPIVADWQLRCEELIRDNQRLEEEMKLMKVQVQSNNSGGDLEGLTSELEKLQLEMAQKVEEIAELEDSLAQAD